LFNEKTIASGAQSGDQKFPSNIEVIQKYYAKIDVTTIAAYDGDRLSTSSAI
jgi:hypothetical protein